MIYGQHFHSVKSRVNSEHRSVFDQSEQRRAGLSLVPGCWATIQPLLYAVFHPKFDPASRSGHLVPKLLCRAAVNSCSVVISQLQQLPDWLDRENEKIFSDDCTQDSRSERVKLNASTHCVSPLVLTETKSAFWPEVEECGFRCLYLEV